MTLEQEAEEYANHNDWFEFSANVDKIGNAIKTKMKRAYIASAKKNGVKWISVKDRLPTEKDGEIENTYIGTDEKGEAMYRRSIRIIAHFKSDELSPEETEIRSYFIDKKTHSSRLDYWMPLPTLPEEGQ